MKKKTLFHNKLNTWNNMTEDEKKDARIYAEEYKKFLSSSKTEREAVNWIKSSIVVPENYVIDEFNSKAISISHKGNLPIEKGINIIIAHIDSPRLDLKPSPLFEESKLAYLKTHYYGGIKKYQWLARPLALHCFVVLRNGETKYFTIGEDDKDPVFTINDLLPHLSHKVQNDKKISEAIQGEKLNVLVGSFETSNAPNKEKDEKRVKLTVLKHLNENYGIDEEDFISAECEVVPAGSARDVGFDRSMIGGYGQDDRVCAYCAYKALEKSGQSDKASMILWVDKEEIGSAGDTGADSILISDAVLALLKSAYGDVSYTLLRETMKNSFCISADVVCAENPDYPEVVEKNNVAKLGYGVSIVKYTGSRGKSGANDAHAEVVGHLRKVFNDNNVIWQSGELGKVDEGGGGTVAKYIAHWGIPTIDCGVPLLSMHSPFEISHIGDIYQTIKGYKAFFKQEG